MESNATFQAVAQPFFFTGNRTGILLIHGFMGMPGEVRAMGMFLAQHGYTVRGVLLARHGQLPDVMRGVQWTEWYESVTEAYEQLAAQCDHVFAVGFSLGGLLALHLAAQRGVAGVVTLAAAVQLAGGWPLYVLPVARYLMPWFYPYRGADFRDQRLQQDLIEKIGQVDFDDPVVAQQLRTNIRIPTGAIYEVVRLGQHVRRELPGIRVPALIVQGRRDEVVVPGSAEQIVRNLGSADKELRWFERSGHLLLNESEREAVCQSVAQWIAAHIRTKTGV